MALEHESDSAIARAVRAAGSQSAFGRVVGKRQSTVREWLLSGRMPADEEMVIKAEKATLVPKEELRPDIYPPDQPASAPVQAGSGLEPAR